MRPAVDPHRGFVGADDPRAAQAGQDGPDTGIEARFGAAERGVERALADRQRKQLGEQARQPPVADRMDDAQVDRERHKVEAEWRAGFHAFRDGGQRGHPTARTMAGIAFDAGDDRLDRRQIDLVVALCETLICVRQRGTAVWAMCWPCDHRLVRIFSKRATPALTAETTFAWPLARAFGGSIGLLPARWWQARIVRPLRRLVQPRLQLRNPAFRSGKPGGQFRVPALRSLQCFPKRADQRVFLGVR